MIQEKKEGMIQEKREKKEGHLSYQLTGFLFVVLLISTGIAATIAGTHLRNEYISLVESRSETVGGNLKNFLLGILELGLPIGSLDGVEKELGKIVKGELQANYANVIDPSGKILYSFPKVERNSSFHPKELLPLLTRGVGDTLPMDGSFNTFVPIFDPDTDEIVGGINIGIPESQVNQKTIDILITLITIFLVFIVVNLVLLFGITQRATRPLKRLKRGALALASGELNTQVKVKARNEIGSLANSFNYMAREIERSQKALKEYSENLEEMVEARTAELKESNLELDKSRREIKSVLENVQHGILTVNSDRIINQEFSDYLYQLFGKGRSIAGEKVESLLYWEPEYGRDRKTFSEWLDLAYNEMMDWDLIGGLGPALITHKINEETRYYQNEFHRVMKEGKIEALMLIITDVTAQKLLEATVKDQEKAYHQEMEIISSIIHHEQEEVRVYLKESEETLPKIEDLFEKFQENGEDSQICNRLFRHMHSLKGNSRSTGMKGIGELSHKIESSLDGIRNKELSLQNELETGELVAESMKHDIQEIRGALERARDIFDKIAGRQESDTGKVRKRGRTLEVQAESIDLTLEELQDLQVWGREAQAPILSKLEELFHTISRWKLVRLDSLYPRLDRVIQDVAKSCGKNVTLVTDGEPLHLEPKAQTELANSLIHMVRNAVDHGLEKPEEREKKGKEHEGKVLLETKKLDGMMMISVSDDGAGIDPLKILNKAIKKGLITEEKGEKMSKNEILRLVLLPGFSSAQEVTEISGRGVGMDVVVDTVMQLKGTLQIESKLGEGSKITISLPCIA